MWDGMWDGGWRMVDGGWWNVECGRGMNNGEGELGMGRREIPRGGLSNTEGIPTVR